MRESLRTHPGIYLQRPLRPARAAVVQLQDKESAAFAASCLPPLINMQRPAGGKLMRCFKCLREDFGFSPHPPHTPLSTLGRAVRLIHYVRVVCKQLSLLMWQ